MNILFNYLFNFNSKTGADHIFLKLFGDASLFQSPSLSNCFLAGLLLFNFISFWYSSLVIFNQKVEFSKQKTRIFRKIFKILTILLWNSSFLLVLFSSDDILYIKPFQFFISFTLSLVSLFIFWWSAITIKNYHFDVIFSENSPEQIVLHGPYRWIRHPFYCSYILCYLGIIILNRNSLISFVSFSLIFYYFIEAKKEERKILNGSQREVYLSYQKKSYRFLPFIH